MFRQCQGSVWVHQEHHSRYAVQHATTCVSHVQHLPSKIRRLPVFVLALLTARRMLHPPCHAPPSPVIAAGQPGPQHGLQLLWRRSSPHLLLLHLLLPRRRCPGVALSAAAAAVPVPRLLPAPLAPLSTHAVAPRTASLLPAPAIDTGMALAACIDGARRSPKGCHTPILGRQSGAAHLLLHLLPGLQQAVQLCLIVRQLYLCRLQRRRQLQ
jgi:hypothetical protein